MQAFTVVTKFVTFFRIFFERRRFSESSSIPPWLSCIFVFINQALESQIQFSSIPTPIDQIRLKFNPLTAQFPILFINHCPNVMSNERSENLGRIFRIFLVWDNHVFNINILFATAAQICLPKVRSCAFCSVSLQKLWIFVF